MLKAVIFLCIVIPLAILTLNRFRRPDFGTVAATGASKGLHSAGPEISVLTWNLGYAGLGEQADFFADKGKSFRALSQAEIAQAAQDIAGHLSRGDWDVICLQENAAAGFLTRGVPLRDRLNAALAQMRSFHWSDLKTILVPPPLWLDHGMSIYTWLQDAGCEILKLPQNAALYFGFLKKYYVGQISRYPIGDTGKDWVVINVHLSAYDQGGAIRDAQIRRVMSRAQTEFEKGHHVVIGGDWNMRLDPTEFDHQTDPKFLFWLVDIPTDALPEGWRVVVDKNKPTVRTLHAAYEPGANYTTIVDGFVVSPNVEVVDVKTTDFGFAFTDHHPVAGRFKSAP